MISHGIESVKNNLNLHKQWCIVSRYDGYFLHNLRQVTDFPHQVSSFVYECFPNKNNLLSFQKPMSTPQVTYHPKEWKIYKEIFQHKIEMKCFIINRDT